MAILRYSPEELNSIESAFQAQQSSIASGLQVSKTTETKLTAIGVAHSAIDLANSNLQSYAEALAKNIQDMSKLGDSFDMFDESQKQSLLSEGLGEQ